MQIADGNTGGFTKSCGKKPGVFAIWPSVRVALNLIMKPRLSTKFVVIHNEVHDNSEMACCQSHVLLANFRFVAEEIAISNQISRFKVS